MRIYNGLNMKWDTDIACPGCILAIEYISAKNSICVSLSDRTFLFFDAGSALYKKQKTFNLPSTQKCLCYVNRKRVLFSAGTDGAVFAWIVDKIFQNDPNDQDNGADKKEYDYKNYITENTPWFLMAFASCIVDLPNIDLIATGSYKKKIELWVLRTQNNPNNATAIKDKSSKTVSKGSKGTGKSKKGSGKNPELEDDISQIKKKTLIGH